MLPVLRAPEMQHLEVPGEGEVGRELQIFLGGRLGVLLPAQLAIGRREPAVGDVAKRPAPAQGDGGLVVAAREVERHPQVHRVPARSRGIEALRFFDQLDRLFRPPGKAERAGQKGVAVGIVGVERDRGLQRLEGFVVEALAEVDLTKHEIVRMGRRVHLHALARVFQRPLERLLLRAGPTLGMLHQVGPGEARVGAGVVGVELDRLLVQTARLAIRLGREALPELPPPQHAVVSLEVLGLAAPRQTALALTELAGERRHDPAGHLVLDLEDVREVAIEALGPEMMSGCRFHQLRRDPHPRACFADAPFQHVADAEVTADLLDARRLALVGHDRIARDHAQLLEAGQLRDQVLGETVGEVVLLGIAAEVRERQHGDRGQGRTPDR